MTHHPDKYRRLARKVWQTLKGPIPKGYQIHHKDSDDTNYSIENLECLPIVEHRKKHKEENAPRFIECQQCGAVAANPWPYKPMLFCSNACKSAARRASGADDEWRICERCQKPFEINQYKKQKYCSLECAPNGLYVRKSFNFKCQNCGENFTANDARAIYCSTKCRKAYDRLKRKLAKQAEEGL